MRQYSGLLISVVVAASIASSALGQSCTGLACQQQTCSGNQTTSISGVVYAPNGTDPLPNITVYVPNAPVAPFTAGVSCPQVGAPPSGSPLVGTMTGVDGSFTIGNMPVGANIPLVIVSGRWRRQLTISNVPACTSTNLPADFAVMPKNQTEGDIPKIAIATGSVDQVECVLRKVGIQDSEFTDASGPGRINLFLGNHGAGAGVNANTPSESSLMGSQATLDQYDVLMLPCQGSPMLPSEQSQELANFRQFADSGGRVYASHYSYDWMYQNPPFDGVANWLPSGNQVPSGTATVDTSFTAGQTLSNWLQLPVINASISPGQMVLNTIRLDTTGVVPPTRSWLALNQPLGGVQNPVMQLVFDTPIAAQNQCGRVLFNEYHVESGTSSPGMSFPAECPAGPMTPQEKLLEYMLFELTADGGQPTLTPTSKDFGSAAVGFTSSAQTFTWTNNASFPAQISSAFVNGDFQIASNNCTNVPAGASCQIAVIFAPTVLGSRSGLLTVQSSGAISVTAALSGTGTPGFSLSSSGSSSAVAFGDQDVGYVASQNLTLTSIASGPLAVPPFVISGPYTVDTSACGSTIAAGVSCPIRITFKAPATGAQPGMLSVNSSNVLYSGLAATLTGNGVDFALALNPVSGKVIAGNAISTTASITPIAGFSFPLSVSCSLGGAVAAACDTSAATGIIPKSPATTLTINFSTTSQYTVIGYGIAGNLWLWLAGIVTTLGVLLARYRAGSLARAGLFSLVLLAVGLAVGGCSGKLPSQNPSYTSGGNYVITVTVTDGFLVHSATYNLAVASK